jgi:hypothetical protein
MAVTMKEAAVTMKEAVFCDVNIQSVTHRKNVTSPLQIPAGGYDE